MVLGCTVSKDYSVELESCNLSDVLSFLRIIQFAVCCLRLHCVTVVKIQNVTLGIGQYRLVSKQKSE